MRYTKMHGAGNGFVLIDNSSLQLSVGKLSEIAVRLCAAEKTDGLLAVTPAEDADFGMLYINSDGTVGEMCGNGARCIARYGYEHGFSKDPDSISFRATAGIVTGRRITEDTYEVRLNDPSVIDLHRTAPLSGTDWDCSYIELGDPGIPVATVEINTEAFDDLDSLKELGRALRRHPTFPKGANVTFVSPPDGNHVRAITFERGVEDFTLACGTGSSGAAVTLILRGRIAGDRVELDVPGGRLSVRICRTGDAISDIYLTGPTAYVSEGEFEL